MGENFDWGALWSSLANKATDIALKILAAVLVLIIGRCVIKWLMKLMKKSKFAKKSDPTVVNILNHFISISLYVLLLVSIVAILGVPMASIIAVIASAGVAIGLALQGALSNLAGGIMILIFRPFGIGNFVDISGNLGSVTDIGIFYTVLTTADNKVITIPNGTVMGASIINYSVKDTRRIDHTFGVAYGSDVEKVKRIILEEAEKHEMVLKDPAPFCRLTKQSDSSLDFTLRVWAEACNFGQVNFDLLESITARFEAEGIEVPYNTIDVNVKQQ